MLYHNRSYKEETKSITAHFINRLLTVVLAAGILLSVPETAFPQIGLKATSVTAAGVGM